MSDRRAYHSEINAIRQRDPAYREAQARRYKRWYERNKNTPEYRAKAAARMRRYTKDQLLRMRHEARWQARRALVKGRLKRQPCRDCGNAKAQMHHEDYNKPLEIIWLCFKCHAAIHANAQKP